MTPEQVGPYRIVRALGRGGMGRVFLAEHETPDFRRTVALKLIDRPGPDEEAVRRFRAEVRVLTLLDHPGIVRFLDGGRSPEGIWFLAREYVEGEDLITHASHAKLDVPARLRLFLEVAEVVEFAHQRGVVHRDLKPTNLLVGRDGRPRLLDFGISKLLSSASSADLAVTDITRTDPLPPTLDYASPEQLAGEPATPASDVFSLGLVLYELLTGRRPLYSDDAGGGPLRPATGSRIDRDLEAICRKALDRHPAHRYPNAAALAEDLRRHLATGRGLARESVRRSLLGWLRSRRGLLATTVAVLLLAGALAWLAIPRSSPRGAAGSKPASPGGFPFDPVNPPPIEDSERRFTAAPDDVVAGAALAIGLEKDKRPSEATLVVGRLRQIPGKELDPLVDWAEGRLAQSRGEPQRAIIFYTRARDNAVTQGREELLGTIRYGRGSILSQLGQRDAAEAELVLARADCERAGDHKCLYRILNNLAIEQLQRGEMEAGEATLQSALAEARFTDLRPLTALSNLAEIRFLRGRPDLAEPLDRELIDYRRLDPNPNSLGNELARLSLIVRDLGRPDEADDLIDQALSIERSAEKDTHLISAIFYRAVADLVAGRLDRLDGLAQELETLAQVLLERRALGYAQSVRAQAAALRGDLEPARRHFAEARRLLLAEGDRDLAALSDLAWAETEAAAGSPQAALRVLDEALAALDEASKTLPGYFADTLRARIEAETGHPDAAKRRLASLGEEAARSPSVSRRIAFLRARGRLAAAEGRTRAARADCEAGIAAARQAHRKVDELELRLELAALPGQPETAARLAAEVEREASELDLVGLAKRARAARAG